MCKLLDETHMQIDNTGEAEHQSIGVGFVRTGFSLISPVENKWTRRPYFRVLYKASSRPCSLNKYRVLCVICLLVLIPSLT